MLIKFSKEVPPFWYGYQGQYELHSSVLLNALQTVRYHREDYQAIAEEVKESEREKRHISAGKQLHAR